MCVKGGLPNPRSREVRENAVVVRVKLCFQSFREVELSFGKVIKMFGEVLKEYEKVKIGKQEIELWKLKERIRNGEDTLGIEHRELDTISNEQLGDYLLELARKWKAKKKDSTTAKIPDATTTPEVTFDQLPQEIKQLLGNIAGKYEVEPKQIYDEYIDLKGKLDKPYLLDDFKRVLANAGVAFERGFIRPLKLNYTDKNEYEKMTIYKLTALNSKEDLINETNKIEGILYDLGEKHILSKRAKSLSKTRLDKADKQALFDYHKKMFDLLKEKYENTN